MSTYIKPFLSKEDSVLDVGSGNGYMANAIIRKTHCKITLIDVIDVSKIGPRPIIYNGLHFPFPNNSFTKSLLICVLHHVRNKEALLGELSRVTGSNIIIAEDVARDIFDRLLGIWHKIISQIKYKSSYVSYRTDREWRNLFKKLNLNIVHEENIARFIDPSHPATKKLYVLQKEKQRLFY